MNEKTLKQTQLLGPVKVVKEKNKKITLATGLVSNLLTFKTAQMNDPFKRWQAALKTYRKRGPIEFRRLQRGDDDAFGFLADDIKVEVFGPIPTKVGKVEGLRFLGSPPRGPRIGQEALNLNGKGFSGK